jgi:hypothetical protein
VGGLLRGRMRWGGCAFHVAARPAYIGVTTWK